MAKPNIGHVKRFIKARMAADDLYIKVKSKFDGMTDSVEYTKQEGYELAQREDTYHECNLGVSGVWIVSSSGNLVKEVQENGLVGYEVYNCCGCFTVLSSALK